MMDGPPVTVDLRLGRDLHHRRQGPLGSLAAGPGTPGCRVEKPRRGSTTGCTSRLSRATAGIARAGATPGTASTSATKTPTRWRWVTAGCAAWPTSNVWPAGPNRPRPTTTTPTASARPTSPRSSTPRPEFWPAGKAATENSTTTGSRMVNGMAIAFGLVPDDLANQIMDRIMAKMREVGYTRFDLGLPWQLVPVPKDDYLPGSQSVRAAPSRKMAATGFRTSATAPLRPSRISSSKPSTSWAGGRRPIRFCGRNWAPMPPTVSRTASATAAR